MIFFLEQRFHGFIQFFRFFQRAEFSDFFFRYFFKIVAFFQETDFHHRILEGLKIGRVPFRIDHRRVKFRDIGGVELRRGCGSRIDFIFVHLETVESVFAKFFALVSRFFHGFLIRSRRLSDLTRIFDRNHFWFIRGKIAFRIEAEHRIFPDFHRDIREIFRVLVTRLNKRCRELIQPAGGRFTKGKI